jgi:hypothetical protein
MRERLDELRLLVNEWDPVGLIDLGAPGDEYDCLLGPVLTALVAGPSVDEIANVLREHLDGHFGVEVARADCRSFAVAAVAWWRGRSGQ